MESVQEVVKNTIYNTLKHILFTKCCLLCGMSKISLMDEYMTELSFLGELFQTHINKQPNKFLLCRLSYTPSMGCHGL